mgnify:CR=1 FL=1
MAICKSVSIFYGGPAFLFWDVLMSRNESVYSGFIELALLSLYSGSSSSVKHNSKFKNEIYPYCNEQKQNLDS